ncbi:MATE family efflux transporter [Rarobacter faecitabidus]|uniref:Putative MATE family efflux protein n=1 Tax=Rarobacter faecitabidus TaxID=13243 RepID=A0A542ZA02_RARFA|nr:MATE family efflux transporter [Rarobacter faecitabidus]TQL57156.1 putative MATE family efflux protein [Rarobacter faecitabidus]
MQNLDPWSARRRDVDRSIARLAVPALGALLAEPLFVLADTAIVGRLGTSALGALSIASTVLLTVVGLCVFLAYATTSSVARYLGAGRRRDAVQVGIDGLWLALGTGVLIAGLLAMFAEPILRALGAEGQVLTDATVYLRWSAVGLPGMLLMLAATGVLRGLQDTRTPLVLTIAGAGANALANWLLVLGLGFGIAGSGIGTAVCQLGMGGAAGLVVSRLASTYEVSRSPHLAGITRSIGTGMPLFIRTLSLRAAILVTVFVATKLGATALAGHQIVTSIWNLIAYGLDALAIAAQALIGVRLGEGNEDGARAVLRRTIHWGIVVGAICGALLAASAWLLVGVFSADPEVRAAAWPALLACAAFLPLAGYVFVLDGVLIGAGDGRYLAWAGMWTLLGYLPAVLAVHYLADSATAGLVWLWIAFGGWFMGLRALATGLRARGTEWLVLGASRA